MKKFVMTFALVVAFVLSVQAAKPKYIFLFIGDGMGMGHVMAAENYNRMVKGSAEPILMMQFPVASQLWTYSANSPVTDSAAAGTALACGVKTKNYMLGVTPDTVAVNSVAHELKTKFGYGVGLVTSVAYDDATPAAHYAHRANRGMAEEINYDGARSNFDFIAGAGTKASEHGDVARSERIFEDWRANGWTVAKGIDALHAEKNPRRVLLMPAHPVGSNEIGYTIDSLPGANSLADLTRECLDHLKRVSPSKFFMMVEGGNIDHAAHGNDGGTVVKEIINFQEALRIAYDFYCQHPKETLIVVTADHDTGGMTTGVKGGQLRPDLIDYQRMSKEKFSDLCAQEKHRDWNSMKQLISERLGLFGPIAVSELEEARLFDSYARLRANIGKGNATLYKEFNNFSETVFDLLNHKTGYGFTTNSHTGNPVPVYAIGVGSERFSRLSNNIDIPAHFRALTGVK